MPPLVGEGCEGGPGGYPPGRPPGPRMGPHGPEGPGDPGPVGGARDGPGARARPRFLRMVDALPKMVLKCRHTVAMGISKPEPLPSIYYGGHENI